jgi:hypothetical protein
MIAAMIKNLKTTKEVAKQFKVSEGYIKILCVEDKTLGEIIGRVRFFRAKDIARIAARMSTRKKYQRKSSPSNNRA